MIAGMARRRRARELKRRLAELDRWDELYGLGGMPSPPYRVRRRRRGAGAGAVWLGALGLAAAAVLFPSQSGAVLARVGDLLPGEDHPVAWAGEVGAVVQEVAPLAAPAPLPAAARLLPEVPAGATGTHRFLRTQPGTGEPVGFSPCEQVEVVVNPQGAPEGYRELVEGSLARVTAASGVLLELVGESEDAVGVMRNPGDPVLIGWATQDEVPGLAGRTVGYGGPLIMTDRASGRSWLDSGTVALDLEGQPGGADAAAVLDHELGHVMGLDHVEDPQELMSAVNTGQVGFGPGDLAGLSRLGSIDCR